MCDYLINLGDKNMKKLTKKQWKMYNESKKCLECKKEYTLKKSIEKLRIMIILVENLEGLYVITAI
jgi:ATP-dependent protease HslVU (ClpYQ) peptidase subunit